MDPYLAGTTWEWRSKNGKSHRVTLEQYHYLAVPQPSPPEKVSLPSGASVGWDMTVPAPSDFGDEEDWVLHVSVLNPFTGETLKSSLPFRANLPITCQPKISTPTLAQAALLDFARSDAILQLEQSNLMRAIAECASKGDRHSQLVVFSQASLKGSDLPRKWQSLDGTSEAILCLRNFLFLHSLSRHRSQQLSTENLSAMAKLIQEGDMFSKEITKAILTILNSSESERVAASIVKPKSTTASPFTRQFFVIQVVLGIVGLAPAAYLIVSLNRRRHKHKSV
jgi:hypothetical protein